MTTSHQHHHHHPPFCLLVPFPPNSLVARSEEGSCGSATCSTTDDTATPHFPRCSCYIFTLQNKHYKFEFIFWNLVGATQLITELRHFFPSVGLLLLLDVQDCSLGDIISNRFDFIVFRALWSCHRLMWSFCDLFARLFTHCQFQYKISFQQIPWHRLVQS